MAVDLDKTTGATVMPASGLDKFYVMHNYVDFTDEDNYLAQNKSMGIFDLPANHLCLRADMRVATVDADISDVDVGIEGATEDGFLNGEDIHSATGWYLSTPSDTYPAAGGYISTSATIIGFTNKDEHTINGAKIHFYALCVDLSDVATI